MNDPHAAYLKQPNPPREQRTGATIVLRYASTRYAIEGLSEGQLNHVRDRFGELSTTAGPGDVTITLFDVSADAFVPIDTRGWEYRLAISYHQDSIVVSGLNFLARIERATLNTELLTHAHDAHVLGAVENTLRVIVAYRLLRQGVLVMHSAAITDEEHGFVLFGQSGAGKSTACELAASRGLRVLSDELNAVPVLAPSTSVMPMPFSGDFGRDRPAGVPCPLTRLYALVQGPMHGAQACPAPQAISRVVAACPYVNADSFLGDQLLEAVSTLVKHSAPRILTFRKDPGFWDVIVNDH